MATPTTDVPPGQAVPAAEAAQSAASVPAAAQHKELWLRPEDYPKVHDFVIEDGKPADNIFSEKQMRLLTEPLHSTWPGPPGGEPFVAMANVGVFHTTGEPAIVADALLATGVRQGPPTERENLAYFLWLRGKRPDVVFEIVSKREGGEDTHKLLAYARIGIAYYIIYDPENNLRQGPLRVYQLQGMKYRLMAPPHLFEELGLGVQLWSGRYEDMESAWLRWCDLSGQLVRTGAERAADAELNLQGQRDRAWVAEQDAQAERDRAKLAEEQARQALQDLEQAWMELDQLRGRLREAGGPPTR